MSNTFYIDANVKNSVNVNSTNNRFTYRLPNALELPTNTEIALQSSIINLQGITGASVELNEDYEDTVIYQYYAIDSSYPAPNREATFNTNANVAYMLNSETCAHNNISTGEFAGLTYPSVDRFDDALAGWSEYMMPLVGEIYNGANTEANRTAVPMLGKSKIKISKGIYSINQLAEIITDQINVSSLVDLPDASVVANRNRGYYDFQRDTATLGFTGYAANNSTLRSFRVEAFDFWERGGIPNLDQLTRNNQDYIGATDFTQFNQDGRADGFCSVIAVTANTNQALIQNAQFNGFTNASRSAGCSFKDITDPSVGAANAQYYMGWMQRNGFAQIGGSRNYNFIPGFYNIFTLGQGFGTSQFKIEYDNNESAYTMNYLHQPRKIPTVDRYGTKMDNAGQECVYIKKPCNDVDNDGSLSQVVKNSLTAAVQKLGGIAITNWGFETCLREGDNISSFLYTDNPTEDRKNKCMQYRHYDDFFTTKEKARAAWDTTIWARMGFQYDDIQNGDINGAGQQNYTQYGVAQSFRGFVTNQEVDNTIQPTISTIFNPTSATTRSAGKPPAPATPSIPNQTAGALPAVSDVQRFMLWSQNIPDKVFTNDTTGGATLNVAPYKGSFYKGAVMIPVLTQGKPFIASKLPILSENGYLLITSDIVEGNDIIKNQQTDGILDLIPKSSLSNQDYMADRNVITHTLSNPKSINEINIKILNPDLTDIALSPNSTFLLRITLPMPKPTNFIFDEELQAKEQQVGTVVQNMVASHTDPNKAQGNIRLDISNMLDVTAGDDGIEPDPVQAAAQGIMQQAIDDDLQGIPPQIPLGGLNPDAEDYAALRDTAALDAAAQVAAQQEELERNARDQQHREQVAAGSLPRPPPPLPTAPPQRPPQPVFREPSPLRRGEEPRPAPPPRRQQPPREEFREPAPLRPDEEPQPEASGLERRERTFRGRVRTLTRTLEAEQDELAILRRRRAEAQGRAVARGRHPREQVALNAQIRILNEQIRNTEGIIRGFGGTPDPEVRRIVVRPRQPRVMGGSPRNPRRQVAEERRAREKAPSPPPLPPRGDDV